MRYSPQEDPLLDLAGILSHHGLISMAINTFKVPLPEWELDPFATIAG